MFNIFLVCLPEGSPKMSTKLRAICCRPWIKLMWRPKKDPWRAWCVSVPRGSHVGSHEGRLGIDTRYKLSNLCMFRAYYVFFSLRIVYVYRYGKHIYICVYIYILIITVCVCLYAGKARKWCESYIWAGCIERWYVSQWSMDRSLFHWWSFVLFHLLEPMLGENMLKQSFTRHQRFNSTQVALSSTVMKQFDQLQRSVISLHKVGPLLLSVAF